MKTFVSGCGVALLVTLLSPEVPLRGDDKTPSANQETAAPTSLAAVVEKLSAENRKKLGEMIAADWEKPPEWVEMLTAILKGEELLPGVGWFGPSEKKYEFKWLLAKFDADADGEVAKEELPSDMPNLERCFARLDRDMDGKLRFSDFDISGRKPSPPMTMSQSFFRLLDSDSNGRVTAEELKEFHARADKDKAGFLTAEDFFVDFSNHFANRNSGEDMPGPQQMRAMFFGGEMGVWEPGPKLGDEAPDFRLPTHDGAQTITLSSRRGKPVMLIFGSFT